MKKSNLTFSDFYNDSVADLGIYATCSSACTTLNKLMNVDFFESVVLQRYTLGKRDD